MKSIKKAVCTIMVAVMVFLMACTVQAKTEMVFGTYDRGVYGSQTGWVRVEDDLYYFHKTSKGMYSKGEACVNDYRWKGRKLYYFGPDGKAVRKNSRYLKLHKDHSVMHIYIPGAKDERYNADTKHYQRRIDGIWQDVGMETNIPWMCDWQA